MFHKLIRKGEEKKKKVMTDKNNVKNGLGNQYAVEKKNATRQL